MMGSKLFSNNNKVEYSLIASASLLLVKVKRVLPSRRAEEYLESVFRVKVFEGNAK